MKKEIEKAIRETLVIENKQSLYIAVDKICNLFNVSERTLDIDSCANLIRSMPTDQAIQIMKSEITKQPITSEICGELVVKYVR